MAIVDFHCHNFPAAIAPRALSALSAKTGWSLNPAGDGTLENHLDHLDLAGVDKAVMMPVATKPSQFGIILNTAIAIREGRMGERAARKIVPFGSIHPLDPDWSKHLSELAAAGITPDLVRFSCGIEAAEDLIADLDHALSFAKA